MSYLKAHRYGLTRIEPSDELRQAGWQQVWQHPSGLLAMRHPATGRWIVNDGRRIDDASFCSSLRAAANKCERLAALQVEWIQRAEAEQREWERLVASGEIKLAPSGSSVSGDTPA